MPRVSEKEINAKDNLEMRTWDLRLPESVGPSKVHHQRDRPWQLQPARGSVKLPRAFSMPTRNDPQEIG